MKVMYRLTYILFFFILACGGDTEPVNEPDPDPVPDPSAASLIFPDNNSECNEGTIVNDAESTVTFRWNASQNTDSYEVSLRNLDTNTTTTVDSSTNEASITIQRGTPYEWFVISRADGTNATANSPTWRFYNQGPGVVNYPPFPAEAVSPQRGSSIDSVGGSVSLEWNGSDVDNDIVEYEVLFDTASDPVTSLGTTANSTIDASVSSGTVYYWRVISTDSAGNTSQSEIFQFRVN